MGQKEKLIVKLKTTPKNFIFDDTEILLGYLTFSEPNKGKTSGSCVKFESEIHGAILLHKPHPQKELKARQVKQLVEKLEQEGLIRIIQFSIRDMQEVQSFQKKTVPFAGKSWESAL